MDRAQGGQIVWNLDVDSKQFDDGLNRASKNANRFKDDLNNVSKQGSDSFIKMGAVMGAVAGTAQVVLSRAIDVLSSSIAGAVRRVDTLNNAPKVLQNLGNSALDSKEAILILDKGIRGLPTSLNEAASALASIASASGKSAKDAAALTLAFNNMALAGGKGPLEAERALIQFTQALGKGKLEMQDYRTLMEVMPAQLAQIAKSLLGPSANAITLKDAMADGTITMDQFTQAILDLNKKGGTNFASFEKQAKDATQGINTGITNAQTAITRGIADIIKAIGSENINKAITDIGKAFENALKEVSGFIKFIKDNKDIFTPIAVGITSIIVSLTAFNAYLKVSSVILGIYTLAVNVFTTATAFMSQGLTIAQAAMAAFNVVVGLNPIGLIVIAVIALVAALAYFFTQTETGKKILQNFGVIAMGVWNGIVSAAGAVVTFFTNLPTIIGNAITAAINWFVMLPESIAFQIGFIIGTFVKFVTVDLPAFIGATIAWFSALPGNIASALSALWSTIAGAFIAAFNWVKSEVPKFIGNVVQFYRDMPGRILGALGNLGNLLVQAGRDIISGLIRGIQAMFGALMDKVKSIASAVSNGFKSAMGIHSPSKVFAGYGRNITDGLIRGIDSGMSTVNAAIDGLAAVTISPTVAPSTNSAPVATSKTVNNIGQVNITHEIDGNYWLNKLTNDNEAVLRGLTPQAIGGIN